MDAETYLKRNKAIYNNKVYTYKSLLNLINTTDKNGANIINIIEALKYREQLLDEITSNELTN